MASFLSTVDSVRAAIEIQRRVIANNDAEKDLPFPLHVRIGINSGQAVSEDNDLFGATVQLASRLCATGESDEIVVSDSVKDLCTDQPFAFVAMGERFLKGFKEPITPFSVSWRDTNPNDRNPSTLPQATTALASPGEPPKPADQKPKRENATAPTPPGASETPTIPEPKVSKPAAAVTSITEARQSAQGQRRVVQVNAPDQAAASGSGD